MANDVYANGLEIACKAAAGKSVAAFPDVCLSPPSPPAGPMPLPYPNTSYASDTTDGSTSVMISGQEVMLKDQSVFKKSTGNEAATRSLGMAVVTHTIQGEASFVAWSEDVKIEGQNVDRHLDLMVQNEQCNTANVLPWTYLDRMALAKSTGKCNDEIDNVQGACGDLSQGIKCPPRGNMGKEKYALTIEQDPCQRALRCMMVPFRKKSKSMCCDPQTPDHVVPASMFFQVRRGGRKFTGCTDYVDHDAPCVCAEGGKSHATHGLLGRARKSYMKKRKLDRQRTWSLGDAAKCAGASTEKVFKQCRASCVEAQVLQQHKSMGEEENINEFTQIKTKHENVNRNLNKMEDSLANVTV